MKENTETKNREWTVKLLLVLFDVFAVNIAYYLALVIRFYVQGQFHAAGTMFMPLFLKFAPYYTVCCLLVFAWFKLYGGVWRYAGWNDISRIAAASGITCLIQIFGTLLFVRRMPITYYAIGAVIQFVLIFLSRFAYRIFVVEASRLRNRNKLAVNVMVVGAGDTASLLLRQLQGTDDNLARPVCVVDPRSSEKGRTFDGLPVVGGLDGIPDAVEKYAVKSVVIADSLMSLEARKEVSKLCAEQMLSVSNFSGYIRSASSGINVGTLLGVVNGPVEAVLDGASQSFENSEQAAASLPENYLVKAAYVHGEKLVLELKKDNVVLNSTDAPWVADYERETGEQISFF